MLFWRVPLKALLSKCPKYTKNCIYFSGPRGLTILDYQGGYWILFPLQYKSCCIRRRQTFFQNMFGLQDMSYQLLKDQVGIQNTTTLCRCNNDVDVVHTILGNYNPLKENVTISQAFQKEKRKSNCPLMTCLEGHSIVCLAWPLLPLVRFVMDLADPPPPIDPYVLNGWSLTRKGLRPWCNIRHGKLLLQDQSRIKG